MSKVSIHNISIRGFGSIVNPISFELDRKGLWFIKGANGLGKSTLFSALSWCLYKVNLKGLNNDQVVSWEWLRGEKWKGTRVAVSLTAGEYDYMIVRHIKYKGKTLGIVGGNSLMIFKKETAFGVECVVDRDFEESDLVGEAQHKGDQQEYINKLLGLEPQAFLSSILFGQRMKRLVESDNSDKRKLFESLFELDFIADVKDKAAKKVLEVGEEKNALLTKLSTIDTRISSIEEQIEDAETWNDSRETARNARITSLKGDKELKQNTFNDLENRRPELKQTADRYNADKETELSDEVQKLHDAWLKKSGELSDKKANLKEAVTKKYKPLEDDNDKLVEGCDQKKKTKLKQLRDELEAIDANLKVAKTNYDNVKKEVVSARANLDSNGTEQSKCLKKVQDLEESITKVDRACPTCKQVIPQADYKVAVQGINDAIDKEREVLKTLKFNADLDLEKVTRFEVNEKQKKADVDKLQSDYEKKEQEIETTKKDDFGWSLLNGRIEELAEKKRKELNVETNQEIIDLNKAVGQAKIDYDDKVIERDSFKKENDVYKKAVDELLKLDSDIKIAKAAFDLATTTLKDYEEVPLDLRDVTKLEEERKTKDEERVKIDADYKKKKLHEERISWWISRAFSSGGLKSYVFSAMLGSLNEQMEKYASMLGLCVRFSVDLSKASKPFVTEVLKDGYTVDYDELSGGEKSRVDTIMAFGVHDIVSRGSDINLLILDEFSSGLDVEGYSVFMSLVRVKAKDKTVYLVEHSDSVDVFDSKFIEVSKVNNSTIFE